MEEFFGITGAVINDFLPSGSLNSETLIDR